MAVKKQDLEELVRYLSEEDVPLVHELLIRLINHPKDDHIPYDDEPLTEEDLQAVKEAEAEYKQGRTIRFEDSENEL